MKRAIAIIAILMLPSIALADALSQWTAQSDAIATTDVFAITDVSDTTDSANGTSKKATGTQVLTFVEGNITVEESMLKAVNSPTDEYCLTYETTTGDFEWQTCASSATAWDDIGNPDANSTIDFGAYVTTLDVEDFRIGDGTNYMRVYNDAGTIKVSFEGNAGLYGSLSGDAAAFSSIAIADLTDTATPSVLTVSETTNKLISNYQATGADHVFTFPTAHSVGNVIFMIGDEFQVDLEPPSGANFYLNGTAMAADEHIQNTADTLGEQIACFTANINGTLTWMCESKYANFVEATP